MLVVDITEFMRNPLRTGIQRVVRELLLHWPHDIAKEVVCFDSASSAFRQVQPDIIDYVVAQARDPYFSAADAAAVIAEVEASLPSAQVHLKPGDRVVVPELFAALDRVQFYERQHAAGVEIFPIVYDFLAWTDPNAVNVPYVGGLNDYLLFLSMATRRAYISAAVRDVFYQRLLRKPADEADVVIPLGADSLSHTSAGRQRPGPYLVCVGALDGRKSQDLVLSAFLASEASECLDLVFAGRVPTAPRPQMLPVLTSTHPRVAVVDDPDDHELAALIRGACASLFISRHEGFGLPAVESLYLGTPIVVDAALPAVSNLERHGQIRLQGTSEAELVAALDSLALPAFQHRLRAEVPLLKLDKQTWKNYAGAVAQWATA